MLRLMRKKLAALAVAGLLAGSALAGGEGWTHDFEGAKSTASTEGKDLLLDFTGSDWCGWCIKLVDEVFSKDEFKAYAKDNLVLVELDFPRRKQLPDDVKKQNAELKEKYGIRGYPTIYLTDAEGRPYAKTGYKAGGPEAYIKHLEELKQVRVDRDKHFTAAEAAEGVEKAKHLHEALQVLGNDMALQHYEPVVKQVMELDADNAAGLKQTYQDLYTAKEQRKTLEAIMRGARGDAEGTIAKLDELVAKQDTVKPIKQEALASKSQIQLFVLKKKAEAQATLLQAIEIDPDSEMADNLRQALKRFFPDGV